MTKTSFTLDARLRADTFALGELDLCSVLLMNNASLPWVILVPRRGGVKEIFELQPPDRTLLMEESSRVGRALMGEFDGDKLNVAALGNQVSQLHLHHVVRYRTDPAWPAPVWGALPKHPYSDQAATEMSGRIRRVLGMAGEETRHG